MPDVICDPPASRVGRRSFLFWPSPAVQHLADSLLQPACVADRQAVWGDPKLLCDLIHRISLQSPLADLPRVGVHRAEQLFEQEPIVDDFFEGDAASRIGEILEIAFVHGYEPLLTIQEFIDNTLVNGRQISRRVFDLRTARRSGRGFYSGLQHDIGCRLAVDFLLTVPRQRWADLFCRLQNRLVEWLTFFVLVVNPRPISGHENSRQYRRFGSFRLDILSARPQSTG